MLFHYPRALGLARRCVALANMPWNTRAFHASQWAREQYLDANQKTFDNIVRNEHANDKVVLVDFYAEWCGPCKMTSPVLEKLTRDSDIKTGSGRSLDLVTVDTDKELGLAQEYSIRSLPTVMAFRNGEPVSQFIGALSEGDIIKFLQQL